VRKGGGKIFDFGGGFVISNKFFLPYFIETYQRNKTPQSITTTINQLAKPSSLRKLSCASMTEGVL